MQTKPNLKAICQLAVLALFASFGSQLRAGYVTELDDRSETPPAATLTLGIPGWSVSEPNVNLWIRYPVVRYATSTGKTIAFDMAYSQVSGWTFSWAGRVEYSVTWNYDAPEPGSQGGWDQWLNYPAQVYPPLGGRLTYADGMPEYNTYSSVSLDSSWSSLYDHPCGVGYIVSYPDGSQSCYKTNICASCPQIDNNTCNKTNYLTWQKDAQGRTVVFNYLQTNNTLLVESITDYDNRSTRFCYDSQLRLVQVTDPYNRTNAFFYDSTGNLTNIVNAANMSTVLLYDQEGAITNMVTPYGTNVFTRLVNTNSGNVVSRSMLVKEPGGRAQLYMYRNQSSKLSESSLHTLSPFSYESSEVPATSPFTNTFDNTWMDARNTFYWSPRAYDLVSASFRQTGNFDNLTTNDYLLAHMKHWLLAAPSNNVFLGNTLSMERLPSPDGVTEGAKVWYDYWEKAQESGTNLTGQAITNWFRQGSGAAPRFVAQVLPDGSTQFKHLEYADFGQVTKAVTTYSGQSGVATRTNRFTYFSVAQLRTAYSPSETMLVSNSWIYSALGYPRLIQASTDAAQRVTSYTYNGLNQLRTIRYPGGLTLTNTYYPNGDYSNFLSTVVLLEIGATNSFTYTNGLLASVTDQRGLVVKYNYDVLQRVTSIEFPDGTTVSNSYDKLDLAWTTDRMGFKTSYARNALGQITAVTNALGLVTTYTVCPCGAVESMSDPMNNTTAFSYSADGIKTSVTYADGTSETHNYNRIGQLTNMVSSAGYSVTNWFNNQGLLYASSNSLGQITKLQFDLDDRVINSMDANGISISQSYDNAGRVRIRSYSDGSESFAYNVYGLAFYTNQIGKVTSYGYDMAGRLTSETNANGGITRFGYIGAGDRDMLTDPTGNTTRWTFDLYGNITEKIDANSNLLFRNFYDPGGRLTNRWTAARGATTYRYDATGNLTNVVYPASTSISLTYDPVGRLTNMIDAVGRTAFTYDGVGSLTSEDGPWDQDNISYTYAGSRRINASVSAPNCAPFMINYAYDPAGRLTNVSSAAGLFGYSYQLTRPGIVEQITLPGGSYITNAYDSMARITTTLLRAPNHVALNSHHYAYDPANQRTQQVFAAGNYISYAYDDRGQLTAASGHEAGGASRMQEQFGYCYDLSGNLTHRTNNTLMQRFTVDHLNQLGVETNSGTMTISGTSGGVATNVTVSGTLLASGAALRYGDNTWARTNAPIPEGAATYTATAYDAAGRTSTHSVSVNFFQTNNFSYDLNGNLISDGRRGFDYDDENQLIRVTVTNVCSTEFVYDGMHRKRVSKEYAWTGSSWVKTNEVRYLYDGHLVVQERNQQNSPVVSYTRGMDLGGTLDGAGGVGGLLARTDHAGIEASHAFYHADAAGNITAMVNDKGRIVAMYSYDPFGGLSAMSGVLAEANRYRFSSKETISSAGLINFGARFYDPDLQRWINRDPIGETGGINLYGFVNNNPVNSIDPYGQRPAYENRRSSLGTWVMISTGWGSYSFNDADGTHVVGYSLGWMTVFLPGPTGSGSLGNGFSGAPNGAGPSGGGSGGLGKDPASRQDSVPCIQANVALGVAAVIRLGRILAPTVEPFVAPVGAAAAAGLGYGVGYVLTGGIGSTGSDAMSPGAYYGGTGAIGNSPPSIIVFESSGRLPGYWDGESGAKAWGIRNGVGAKEGKRRFHQHAKRDDPMQTAAGKYQVNPDTGDVADAQGTSVGNLEDCPGDKSH